MPTNVVIVEDDHEFRATLCNFLNDTPGYHCAYACDTAEEALRVIPSLRPDVVLMDICLPVMSGIVCTRQLKEICPLIPVIILTAYEDSEKIIGAFKAGASGYLLKKEEAGEILRAIQAVLLGGGPMSSQVARRVIEFFYEKPRKVPGAHILSKREVEILEELAKGYSTKEIARSLSISAHTVHTHLQHIYEKLHVSSRVEAVVKYLG